ncbi:MAG: hypothetical protein QOJ86_2917 [Bradyrhizobium sp.]|nr:hypothetical protein [Bradyrhizobium sp.]
MNYRSTGRVLSAFALALLCLLSAVGAASAQQCMTSYYREKSPACVDQVLAQFRQMPPNPRSEPSNMIGFLAGIFRDSAQERERILKAESSNYVRSVMLLSLYRAGLPDDAQKFAAANDLAALSEKLRGMRLVALDAVKPSSIPGENDLLIGAYMASGNATFIQRILDNYSSADDAMASDGFRVGLMMSKFGPGLAPKGRKAVTVQAACEKYRCKEDQTKLLRVMTLGTALWSLQSLSGQDAGIQKTLSDFFARDTRLKMLFTTEQTAFGNYLTAMVVITTFKDDHTGADREQAYAAMDKSASIYESLGSAKEAFAPTMNLKK